MHRYRKTNFHPPFAIFDADSVSLLSDVNGNGHDAASYTHKRHGREYCVVACAAYALLCDTGAGVDQRVVLCSDVNALGWPA